MLLATIYFSNGRSNEDQENSRHRSCDLVNLVDLCHGSQSFDVIDL